VTCLRLLSGALPDDERGELVFRGDLLVLKGVRPLLELVELADALIRETLGPTEEPADEPVEELQRRFRRDPRVGQLVSAALEAVGVDAERTYWDWLHLRVQPPGGRGVGWDSGTLGAHRDTWSSNVYAQTNWWTPLRPLSGERTIAMYPAYWERPIANTSAAWDLERVREQRRGRSDSPPLPLVPEPSEPVDPSSELRIVIEPGDLLCFSGAHLHASVPNTSGETRFSAELRTVSIDDLLASRGAPNIDGRAPRVPFEWFRRIADGAPLPDDVRA
jgi:hypothetical protein